MNIRDTFTSFLSSFTSSFFLFIQNLRKESESVKNLDEDQKTSSDINRHHQLHPSSILCFRFNTYLYSTVLYLIQVPEYTSYLLSITTTRHYPLSTSNPSAGCTCTATATDAAVPNTTWPTSPPPPFKTKTTDDTQDGQDQGQENEKLNAISATINYFHLYIADNYTLYRFRTSTLPPWRWEFVFLVAQN